MDDRLSTLRTRFHRFLRGEDGSMTGFSLFLLIVMLIVAGMSVDVARHEERRALVQSTLDRAVLASASLDQNGAGPDTTGMTAEQAAAANEAAAKAIVQDYFTKSGVDATLGPVDAVVQVNSRRVSATANANVGTYFMRLIGIDDLLVPASSTAMESAQDIEIVLVLDVSWSMEMNGSQRLANLRTAATKFVDTVLANDPEHRVSISIVPFNGQVNLGQRLFNAFDQTYNVTDYLTAASPSTLNSYCVDLPDAAFAQRTIPTSLALPQAGHFDAYGSLAALNGNYEAPLPFGTNANSTWSQYGSDFTPRLIPVCRLHAGNTIQVPTSDAATLRARIAVGTNGLLSGGFTSIHLGMKWGLMMLDPSFRTVLTNAGMTGLPGRPFDYGNPITQQKYIVLMTDGENQASHALRDAFRTGTSPIWRHVSGSTSRYSLLHAGRAASTSSPVRCRPFWVPHLTGTDPNNWATYPWQPRPWNGTAVTNSTACYSSTTTYTTPSRLTWQEVWSSLRINWVAYQLYARGNCMSGLSGTNDQTCRNREYLQARGAIRGPNVYAADGTTVTDTLDEVARNGSTVNPALQLTEFATPMNSLLQQTCTQAKAAGVVVYGIAFEAPTVGQQQISQCASSRNHYFPAQGTQLETVFGTIAAQINALKLVR